MDYAYNGITFVNNILRKQHKKLTNLMIYSTSRCNSKCKHCNIWQKPSEDLTFEEIKNIMQSDCITKRTVVGLEGGEFLLHPQYEQILDFFHTTHPNYTLLSNGLQTEKLTRAVTQYHPKRLYLSLDEEKETYKYMRGIDGYDRVIRTIETLREKVPVSLMFCLSPFNSFEDMQHVIDIALKYNVDLRIGIYATMSFFDTKSELLSYNKTAFLQSIPKNIHLTAENYDFLRLYCDWKQGNLRLNCHSIYSQAVIHSNGDVPLCQNLGVMLGNIRKNSLDEILNSSETTRLQDKYCKSCNGCWINYHRKFDIILLRNIERFFPKKIIEKIYGTYYWNSDRQLKYKDIIK